MFHWTLVTVVWLYRYFSLMLLLLLLLVRVPISRDLSFTLCQPPSQDSRCVKFASTATPGEGTRELLTAADIRLNNHDTWVPNVVSLSTSSVIRQNDITTLSPSPQSTIFNIPSGPIKKEGLSGGVDDGWIQGWFKSFVEIYGLKTSQSMLSN
jgi:hypothetical protein